MVFKAINGLVSFYITLFCDVAKTLRSSTTHLKIATETFEDTTFSHHAA